MRVRKISALNGCFFFQADDGIRVTSVTGVQTCALPISGVGKSRLFRELVVSGAVRDWLVLESVVASYGKPAAWLPVIELLKAYFQIDARDGDGKIRDKVTGKLYSLDASLEPLLRPLLWLLDVHDDDASWARLDPRQRRHLTLDAVKRL